MLVFLILANRSAGSSLAGARAPIEHASPPSSRETRIGFTASNARMRRLNGDRVSRRAKEQSAPSQNSSRLGGRADQGIELAHCRLSPVAAAQKTKEDQITASRNAGATDPPH